MSNELAKVNKQELSPVIDEQTLKDYLFGSGAKLNDEQMKLFIGVARSSNLNPFKREIYAIPFERNVKTVVNGKDVWEKKTDISIVSGYQIYIDRAMATGQLDGWDVETTQKGAKITIYRKDFKFPFKWEVSKSEFEKKDREGKAQGSWKTMPEFMIKKVAIGQGFRLAFPNEMGGLPYLQEEITLFQEGVIETEKAEPIKSYDEIMQENYVLYFEKLQNIKSVEELKQIYNEIKKKKFTKEHGADLSEIVKNIKAGLEEKAEDKKDNDKLKNPTEEEVK